MNWITDQTRTGDAPLWEAPRAADTRAPGAVAPDDQHDFDMGTWKIHMRRLLHPLSGSTEWTEMDGTTVTHKIWNGGRANLATVEADGPDSGILSVPAVGEFRNGRGEFYDHEKCHGRSILVRFRIWPVSPDSVASEQAFSDDGGQTWETNWVNTITRVRNSSAQ